MLAHEIGHLSLPRHPTRGLAAQRSTPVRAAPGASAGGTQPIPQKRPRPKWLWPIAGILVLGALVVLALACVLSIPVLTRLAEGTATPTRPPATSTTAARVATVPPVSTLPPSDKATPEPGITLELGAPLYEEDFSSPGVEWEISESEEARYRVDGGTYSIEVLKANWIAWNLIGEQLDDFEIEFEVALVEGDPYNDAGLLFRFQDADNYYEVDINGEGSFAIGKEINDEWTQIVDWTSHSAVKPFGGVNRVRIVAEGNQFVLYVNDAFVIDFVDDSFASGGIGPVVTAYDEPPARATFDNITIWDVESK